MVNDDGFLVCEHVWPIAWTLLLLAYSCGWVSADFSASHLVFLRAKMMGSWPLSTVVKHCLDTVTACEFFASWLTVSFLSRMRGSLHYDDGLRVCSTLVQYCFGRLDTAIAVIFLESLRRLFLPRMRNPSHYDDRLLVVTNDDGFLVCVRIGESEVLLGHCACIFLEMGLRRLFCPACIVFHTATMDSWSLWTFERHCWGIVLLANSLQVGLRWLFCVACVVWYACLVNIGMAEVLLGHLDEVIACIFLEICSQ